MWLSVGGNVTDAYFQTLLISQQAYFANSDVIHVGLIEALVYSVANTNDYHSLVSFTLSKHVYSHAILAIDTDVWAL